MSAPGTIGWHLGQALHYQMLAEQYNSAEFGLAGDSELIAEYDGAAAGHAFRAAELAYDLGRLHRPPPRKVSRQTSTSRANLAAGFCALARRHGPPVPGKRLCEACINKAAARAAIKKATREAKPKKARQPKEERERKKRIAYEKRRAAAVDGGFCATSASHGAAVDGNTLCMLCRDKKREQSKGRVRNRRNAPKEPTLTRFARRRTVPEYGGALNEAIERNDRW